MLPPLSPCGLICSMTIGLHLSGCGLTLKATLAFGWNHEKGRKEKMTGQPENASLAGFVQYINPDNLPKNPAYTNVIVVSGSVKTIYIGAQGSFDASTGTIVGKGDIGVQSLQVMKNIQAALAAAGAGLEHIIKWN